MTVSSSGIDDTKPVEGAPTTQSVRANFTEIKTQFDNTHTDLLLKAPIASPSFTGNISVTGTVDSRDISVDGAKLDGIEAGATADQTKADIDALGINAASLGGSTASLYALLASPALTGNPTAPTQTSSDNSTKIATTAYADAAGAALTGLKSVTGTVASSALTAGLKADTLYFRNSTLTNGIASSVTFSDLSLVVPSTATLGTVNAIQSRLILLAIDNAGTVELAIVNQAGGVNLDETGLISTTAISTTADSNNVIYSTTARTNVAYRVVGFIESTQATAGTWATAPSTLQGAGGEALTTKPIKSGAVIATTSGTSHDFTGIPSWAKKITLMLDGVSLSGASELLMQIGDSGGIENTGYIAYAVRLDTGANGSAASTAGFVLNGNSSSARTYSGSITLSLLDQSLFTWVSNGSLAFSNRVNVSSGGKSLSAILDRIRLTAVNGTDTFDAGSINILYE